MSNEDLGNIVIAGEVMSVYILTPMRQQKSSVQLVVCGNGIDTVAP